MSYRVRYTFSDGRTGHWMRDYATREAAQQAIDDRMADTGLLYYVEEVATPEARIRELEAELAQLREAYDAAVRDYDAARRNVAGYKAALAASRKGPSKASEAPGEGGDSGSSSFDALEAFLRADTDRSIKAIKDGRFIVIIPGLIGSPASCTLKGILARVEEMVKSNAQWLVPIDRPEDKFGEGTNRWRLNSFERFLDGNDDASITWHEGQFHAVAEGVRIQATTICGLADKLAEKREAKP